MAAERMKFQLDSFRAQIVASEVARMASVTLSELHYGVHRANTEDRKRRRLALITNWVADFPVVAFDGDAAIIHADIVANLEGSGQSIGLKDSMIAATALAHDWSVATLNLSEVQRVPGLKVIDAAPWLVK
jgi:predicted nucleic acid-binding protein